MELRKGLAILTLSFLWITTFCDSQTTAIQHLNTRVNRLNRITNGLQRDVDDIWTALSNTVVNSGNSKPKQVCNETEEANSGDKVLKLVNETVSDVEELKSEVEELLVYAQNGLMNEKAFSHKAIGEMKVSINEFDLRLNNKNLEMKNWQQSFEETIQQVLEEKLNNMKSNMEQENILFQQKMYGLVNDINVKIEQNEAKAEACLDRLKSVEQTVKISERQAADLREEVDAVKDVINEKLACNTGWERFADQCYFFGATAKSWQQAWDFCKSKDSHLVELSSTAKTDFLMERCSKVYSIWVSANDMETEGSFIWENSNQSVSPEYFNSGEPNGGRRENCAELYCQRNRKMNDNICGSKKYFFCEGPIVTLQ